MAKVKELLKQRAGISIDLPSTPAASKPDLASSAKNRNQGYQTQTVLKPPASAPLKPPARDDGAVRQRYAEELRQVEALRKEAPTTMNGRLSGHGMNLTGEEQAVVMEKEADSQRRFKAGAASLGYTAVGMLPNFLETLDQSNKNYEANRANLPYQRAKAEAEKVNSYAMSRLVAETGQITGKHQEYLDKMAKADALAIKTPVNQSLFGQRMMAKSREAHEIATEGMGTFEKLVADTAISIAQNLPAIGVSVLTKNPMAGVGLMSLQAASQKTAELNARGIDPATALGRGIVSGAIEGATEKMPLENLMEIVKGKTGRTFLANFFKQAGIEGVEEGVAYAGNFVADAAANDPEAQFSLMDLGMAVAGGVLSGGVLGSAGHAVGVAFSNRPAPRLSNVDSSSITQIAENPMLPRAKEPMLPRVGDTAKGYSAKYEDKNNGLQSSPASGLQLSEMEAKANSTVPKEVRGVNSQPMQDGQGYTQKAAPYLPTYQQAQNIQRMRESGKRHGVPQETIDRISDIAKRFNVQVEFVDTLGDRVNGKYENGKITIAKDTKNPVMAVFTHELTHHIESSGQYEKLDGMVQNYIGKDFDSVTQGIKKLYAQEGVQLDDAGARQEAVATFIENRGLFEDKAFIQRVTQENPSLARQILDWIKDTVRKLGASADTRFLIDAQRLYEKAMRESVKKAQKNTATEGGEGRYSLNPDFGRQVDQWFTDTSEERRNTSGGYFMIGTTSDALKSIGVRPGSIFWRKQKIGYIMQEHPEIDAETVKAIPNIIENPVVVMKSRTREDSLVLFGDVVGADGKPVMASLELTPRASGDMNAEFALLTSAYGRSEESARNLVLNSELLYLDTNKNRTNTWLMRLRVQFPSGQPVYGSIGSVTYQDGSVKIVGVPYNQLMQKGENDAQFSRSDVSDFMKQYLEQYGAIQKGETPHREVDIPKETPQGKTRRFARTMMESEAIPDSMMGDFEEAIVNGTFAYSPISDKESQTLAERTIKDKGFDGALQDWEAISNGKKFATKHDIVLGETLLNQAANAGDVKLAMKLAAELAAEGTRAGQNVQALRLLKRMKPDGQLYYLQKSVQKVNADLLDRLKLKAPNVKIDEALAQELLSAQNQKEIDIATDKIMQNIADQIPPSWTDKWNAWRYLSMLGNPRTHVRNLIGNAVFMPAVNLKNLIATPMEAMILKEQRTKAVLTGKDKGLKNFAEADFENVKAEITGGGKLNPSDAIRDKQTIFKTKPLEAARKTNLNALEAEDALFLKRHYISSMAQVMKARGYTADFMKSGTKEGNTALEEARNYAIEEAKKATYRDASVLANAINNFKRSGPMAAVIGEGLMPFTKTPINIAKRGMEYSPIGLANGAKYAMVDVRNGTKTASQAIDQLASGLSGTGIMLLGIWLASLDLLSGGASDDKKESLFDRLQGLQNYALKIGDYTYTLDWAAPSSLPLFVGVELHNMVTSGGKGAEKSLAAILDSLTKIGGPMIDMSMLQGIDNLFRATSYGTNPLPDAIVETMTGYFGQGVPTLFGQVARTIDGTRRTRFVDKNSGVPEFAQKFLQTQQAKIPFASKALMPHVDAWGRTQENGGVVGRAAQNFLSPGYVSKSKTGAVDEELMRLYNATGESSVLPSNAAKYIRFDDETKRFTAEEYFTYASTMGQASYQNINDLITLPHYARMTNEEKVATISALYSYASAVAKTKVSDYTLKDNALKAHEAEKQGVKPFEYFTAYTAQKDVEGDSDSSGGTISGTENINKRHAIDEAMAGMSFDRRDALYKAMGVGLSEGAEKKWAVPSVQKAVGSREKYYKIQGIISSAQGNEDEYGNTIDGSKKAAAVAEIRQALGVSKEKAADIYARTVTWKYELSELTSKQQRAYDETFKKLKMSETKYINCLNALRGASGVKNPRTGRTINGTLKRDQLQRLVNAGLTYAQANHFYKTVVR